MRRSVTLSLRGVAPVGGASSESPADEGTDVVLAWVDQPGDTETS
jgi:hypothetical protein